MKLGYKMKNKQGNEPSLASVSAALMNNLLPAQEEGIVIISYGRKKEKGVKSGTCEGGERESTGTKI